MIGSGLAFAPEDRAGGALRLRDLLGDVKSVLSGAFRDFYWIIAEVSSVKVSRAGHYYFELIDPERDGTTMAYVRANLWAGTASRVVRRFREVTKQEIAQGMTLLMQVKVEMSLQYGFSLTILDINPEYTLGNLERKREATVKQLQEDGVFDLNKRLPLPRLLLRVAVISSETAAGYGDFMTTIRQSGLGDFLSIKLFQANMQGQRTTETVNSAFSMIFYYREDFDAVFIMRGGGSKQDLAAFDDYDLCTTIANFPLPVLTAIGHEQDTSVADLVAHMRLKTPTALGEFLTRRLMDEILWTLQLRERLQISLHEQQRSRALRLSQATSRTQHVLSGVEREGIYKLNVLSQRTRTLLLDRQFETLARVKTASRGLSIALINDYERCYALLSHTQERLPSLLLKHYHESRNSSTALAPRLQHALRGLENSNALFINRLTSRLIRILSQNPATERVRQDSLQARLSRAIRTSYDRNEVLLQELARRTKLLDPSQIMARGFAIITNTKGETVTETSALCEGEEITISLLDGEASAITTRIKPNN